MCSHTGACALRCLVRQGMQASAAPLQSHPASPTPSQVGMLASDASTHAATLFAESPCRPVLPPGKAVQQAHHPCYQMGHAGDFTAMQVLTTSAVCHAGHAGQPCSPVNTCYSPSPCARQPCSPALPPMRSHKGAALQPWSTRAHPLPLLPQCYPAETHNPTKPHDAARQQRTAHLRTWRLGSRCWRYGQAALQEPGHQAPEQGLLA